MEGYERPPLADDVEGGFVDFVERRAREQLDRVDANWGRRTASDHERTQQRSRRRARYGQRGSRIPRTLTPLANAT